MCSSDLGLVGIGPRQSHYFYDDNGRARTVKATSGVDQGDPLSAVLFMIGMISVMDAVGTRTAVNFHAQLAAYIDDWMIIVRAAGITPLLAIAEDELAKIGLQLNRGKTQLWQPPAEACVGQSTGTPQGQGTAHVPSTTPVGTAPGQDGTHQGGATGNLPSTPTVGFGHLKQPVGDLEIEFPTLESTPLQKAFFASAWVEGLRRQIGRAHV